MTEQELLPCPMCGSEARLRNHRVLGDSLRENLNRVWVECTNDDECGLRQTMFGYTQEALAAWNRRQAAIPKGFVLMPEKLSIEQLDRLCKSGYQWKDETAIRGYYEDVYKILISSRGI